jgi:hypothetical protein
MNYAEAIEDEGAFEKARRAWVKAAEEWRDFGKVVIEHSTGVRLQLGREKEVEKELNDMRVKLDAILPGTREKLVAEKRESLTPDDRRLLDLPPEQVSAGQSEERYKLDQKVQVKDRDVAERIALDSPERGKDALQLANQIERQETLLNYTRNYKRDANYDYWMTRADFEQTPNAVDARRYMFEAKQAADEADITNARRLYEQGFAKWRLVIDQFPEILDEEAMTGEDILDFIKRYRDVLDQFDQTIPEDFPLWEVIEKFDREQNFTEELAEHKKRQGGDTEESRQSTTQPEQTPPATPEPTPPAAPESTPTPAPESSPEATTPATPEATPSTTTKPEQPAEQ